MSVATDIRLLLMSAAAHTSSQKLRIDATFTENMLLVATFAGGGLNTEPLALSVPFGPMLALKEAFRPRWLRLPTRQAPSRAAAAPAAHIFCRLLQRYSRRPALCQRRTRDREAAGHAFGNSLDAASAATDTNLR